MRRIFLFFAIFLTGCASRSQLITKTPSIRISPSPTTKPPKATVPPEISPSPSPSLSPSPSPSNNPTVKTESAPSDQTDTRPSSPSKVARDQSNQPLQQKPMEAPVTQADQPVSNSNTSFLSLVNAAALDIQSSQSRDDLLQQVSTLRAVQNEFTQAQRDAFDARILNNTTVRVLPYKIGAAKDLADGAQFKAKHLYLANVETYVDQYLRAAVNSARMAEQWESQGNAINEITNQTRASGG